MNTEQEAQERYPLSKDDGLRIVTLTREALIMQLRSAFTAGAAASRKEAHA